SLGLMYDTGEGVTQDDVQAHMWFNLVASRAAGRAREMAVEDRDLVARRMTAAQLAEAQRLAREWDEAHPPEP
ncbi:MAG TPA: SEL1-like repeat protein, partial [Vicinamibacterales bacterium]|nr:SEL1-like repeat protein [Vicinamibacterales bacterium]